MQSLNALDPQRFVIDTLRTTAGTVVRIRYPALNLSCEGRPRERHVMEQQLRQKVVRALLENPGLLSETMRWDPPMDSRQAELIKSTQMLGPDEVIDLLQKERGEALYVVTALALMRGYDVWSNLAARPDMLRDAGIRSLLSGSINWRAC